MKTNHLLAAVFGVLVCSQPSFSQTLPSYVPSNGLIGWWPFNGNANDESGNANHGTPMNGPTLTQDRFGVANRAYNFDGINDYIICNRDYYPSFSASVWFKSNQVQAYAPLIDAFDCNWEILLKNSNPMYVSFASTTSWQELVSTTSTQNNTWYHLVCVYSNNTVSLHLNGAPIAQFTVNPLPQGNGKHHFGGSLTSDDQFLNGVLDDVGIWNRELAPDEIRDLYLSNDVSVSLKEIQGNEHLEIFPNPATTRLHVSTKNLSATGFSIFDVSGKAVLSGKVDASHSTIELDGLPAGVYSLKFETQALPYKFIKRD